jgi:hypothetical protein
MRARLRPPALTALGAVLVAGLALRVLLAISLWPVSITLDDAYESYAGTNPFEDPLHPAGYSLILAAIGAASRQVAVTITIQHGLGLVSAVLLWAAVRRVTGSPWVGLLPAAMVSLNPDGIVLEHAISRKAGRRWRRRPACTRRRARSAKRARGRPPSPEPPSAPRRRFGPLGCR